MESVEYEKKLAAAGWESLNDGDIQGWEDDRTVEGVLLAIRQGQYGKLAVIRQADGSVVTVGCPTILASRLDRAEIGDRLYIHCDGKVETQGGMEAWAFTVYRKPKVKPLKQESLGI